MPLVPALVATQGDLSNYNKHPDEPDGHAIGRSRGGLTTKIHALADQRCSAVTMALSPGQAGDNPMLWPLLTAHQGPKFRLLADKGLSALSGACADFMLLVSALG